MTCTIFYNGGTINWTLCILGLFFVAFHLFRRAYNANSTKLERWNSVPRAKEDWLYLILFTAKIYIVLAYLFLVVAMRLALHFGLLGDDAPIATLMVSRGYLFVVMLLVFGALIQSVAHRFYHAIETAAFVLLGLSFRWMIGEIYFMGR